MLAQDVLAQLLFLLGEDDVVFQQLQQMRDRTETFDLGFEVANLLMLPVKNVTPERIPRDAVGEADGLGGGEEHLRHHDFRRLHMVTANLVHAERDRLVLAGVLTLDDEHWNPVDEEDHVLARAVMTVVKIKLFRDLIDVAPLFPSTRAVLVINQGEVQFPIVFGAEEFTLVAQVGQKLTVAGDVCIEPPELADQRAFSLFVFWIKSQNLGMEQIVEVQRCQSSTVFRCSTVGIKTTPALGLGPRARKSNQSPVA